jgi:L-threonylcarbamoyladenylate synthase
LPSGEYLEVSNREPRVEILTDPPDPALIEEVSTLLLEGGVAVLPTDTVYGLSTAAESATGLARVRELKSRDITNALPVFVADMSQARAVAKFNPAAEKLAAEFWPGALTLVLERRPGIAWDLGGSPQTIGIRCPKGLFLQEICRRAGPITATSANRSGEIEARNVEEAVSVFGSGVDIYVDGGPSQASAPSTVVKLTGEIEILRRGAILATDIFSVLR